MSGEDDLGDFSMLELFREEAETQIALLSEGLVALERATETKPLLDELMRAAHSMKGAARIVGLDPLVKLAHAVEDIFVAAQRGELTVGAPEVDVLLGAVDAISTVAYGDAAGLAELEAKLPGLLESLALLRAGQLPERTSVALAPAPPEVPPLDTVTPAAELDVASENAAPTPAPAPTSTPPPPPTPTPTPTPTSTSKPAPAPPTAAPRGAEKSIRMTTEAIERLTGLTAETVVEATRLEHLMDDFGRLRDRHRDLYKILASARGEVENGNDQERLSSGLTQALACLEECARLLGERDARLEQYARRSANLANRLSHETLSSRMMPFGSILRGYPRLVRDLARDLNKICRLEIRGEATKIDREILERLDAPLNHIVRNALDHGLESGAERARCGKPAEGRVTLEAYHRAGQLRVVISDDGGGIDVERLRAKVVEKQLETPQRAADLSQSELFEFLFLPSFSTTSHVTEISGRGVGLDAVRTMVQEARGSVTIRSIAGQGTTFDIELPVTRSVSRALLVKIGGDKYAIPIARIERVLEVASKSLHTVEGRPYFGFEGIDIALVPAAEVLELGDPDWRAESLSVVVIRDTGRVYGLVVESFAGERDLVVRPLDTRLGHLPDVAAVATDEAGGVVLILDVEEVVRGIDALITGGGLRRPSTQGKEAGERLVKRILVVDDSLTVRQAERQLLESNGYTVDVAVDGMEGWSAVRLKDYQLVVSDVDMPRMNGIELVRKIRGEARLQNLPVVIVSYKDRAEDRLQGLEAGANHYLAKGGFRDTALLEVVVDLIGPAREEPAR